MDKNYFGEQLERNFFNTLFSIAGKTWLNITFSNLVYTVVSLVFVLLIFIGTLGTDVLGIFTGGQLQQNPQLLQGMLQENMTELLSTTFIGSIILFSITMMIIVSWMQYFSFIATSEYLKNQERNFMTILKKSLSTSIFRVLGIILLLYLYSV